jgi:thiamine biosynthesis lipoprotein
MSVASATATPARRVLIPLDIARPPVQRPAAAQPVVRLAGATMGTSWSVLAATASASITPVRQAILAVLDGIIAQMSTWDAASDICAFNASAAGTWHPMADDFATVLDGALKVAQASGGAYDPTIGALVGLWGFGPSEPSGETPDGHSIIEALAHAGWQRLQRDGRNKVMQPGGLHLDLSSIAKGYAVDRVSACLDRLGIANYLVEIGGELRGRGVKPDGAPWWVALERPVHDLPDTIVALHGWSIATSGDQQRFVECDGRRLPHILDPRSGCPVQNGTVSVTVIHRQCMLADAWATALMVPKPDAALTLASAQNLAARIVVRGEAGWDELVTPAFTALLD